MGISFTTRPPDRRPLGNRTKYAYDAMGRRIEMVDEKATATTRFYHDGLFRGGRVLEDVDDSAVVQRYYVWGNYIDELLMMWREEGETDANYFVARNHLFSPAATIAKSDGSVVERYEYDVYGRAAILDADFNGDADGVSDVDLPYLFTGRRLDVLDSDAFDIMYYRARYYDIATGRLLQRDRAVGAATLGRIGSAGSAVGGGLIQHNPIAGREYADGMNLYQYVQNNPTGLADPYGLWSIVVDLREIRALAGDLVLYDNDGKPLLYCVVRGQGKYTKKPKSKPWWQVNGDTPTGEWKGKVEPRPKGHKAEVYGPGDHIRLTAVSGHAITAVTTYGRSGFLIHGGRPKWAEEGEVDVIVGWEEIKDEHGNTVGWKPIWKKQKTLIPANTNGCIRGTNECVEKLTTKIRELVKCGDKEVGKVTVTGQQPEPPK